MHLVGTVIFTKDSALSFLGKSKNMGLVHSKSIEWNKYTNRCVICIYCTLTTLMVTRMQLNTLMITRM